MYQLWKRYSSSEGWEFEEFNTLEEVIKKALEQTYASDIKITKTVNYKIKEVEESNPSQGE